LSGESTIFPPEFLEESKQTTLMGSWCPQEHVLKHPSMEEFFTQPELNQKMKRDLRKP
jgi:hypothetical protein